MRLFPRSLFSRLVLVLLTGLIIAQVLSLAIHREERERLITRATGMQSAQRIADIVKILDPMAPAERQKMAAVLSAPPLLISLGIKAGGATEEDPARQARAAIFETMLKRFLGGEWPVTVVVTDAPPWMPGKMGGEGMGMFGPKRWAAEGSGMYPGAFGGAGPQYGRGISFIARVRLTDGTLVTFDSRQSVVTQNWPYRLMVSLAVMLLAIFAVSLIAVRWVTRPLKTLADAAERLGRNINQPPLAESGPNEVQRAARAFNTMQAQLIGYIRGRTRILAAISHDLKTPITRMRLRAELLDDAQAREKLGKDLDEMEAMVKGTLDFMRGLETEEHAQPIDVDALVQSLQSDYQESGQDVRVEGAARAPYSANPQALKRCLTNLLDNAVKYGKSARVLVDDSDERLELRVQDEGPGIPEAALERVFEPFYRLEESRNRETGGTGLGLSIARTIAQSLGGSLILRNRATGGLEAVLTLPRARR
jgi:signal transduction histidine kinase